MIIDHVELFGGPHKGDNNSSSSNNNNTLPVLPLPSSLPDQLVAPGVVVEKEAVDVFCSFLSW